MAKANTDKSKKDASKANSKVEEILPQREQKKVESKKDLAKKVVAQAVDEVKKRKEVPATTIVKPIVEEKKPKESKELKERKNSKELKVTKEEKAISQVSVEEKQTKDSKKKATGAEKKPSKDKIETQVIEDRDDLVDEATLQEKFNKSLNQAKQSLKISDSQIKQAVGCLKTILNKRDDSDSNVFKRKEDESIFINFNFAHLPVDFSIRPVVIPVKIESSIKRKVCLIIKDPAQIWLDLNINFEDHPELDVMVIPFSQLKLEYAMYEQKRNLLKQFDAFVCDTTIYMHLKKVLGREFYDSKKYPINVKINSQVDPKKIKNDIIDASSNYLFYMSKGPNYSVKAGFAVEKETELVKKIQTAITHTAAHILKWDVDLDNLKTISVKLSNSIELPIYNSLTKEEILIAKQVVAEGITPRTAKDKTDRTKIDLTQRNKLHSEKKGKAPEKVKGNSKNKKSNKK